MITALNNRWELKEFIVEECKTMDSKKVPIWLEFKNKFEGADDIKIMFKCGDDIR